MDAPDKLYLPLDDALETYARKDSDEEIEYIRTDAFIEKACEWLKENADMYEAFDSELKSYYMDKDKLVEDFKEYMKRE